MKYPLEQIVKIRAMREESAKVKVVEKNRALERAQHHLEQNRLLLKACEEKASQKNDANFGAIANKTVSAGQIHFYQSMAQWLQVEKEKQRQNVNEAGKQEKLARQGVREAKAHYYSTYKKQYKIKEHRSIWLQKQTQKAGRAEDEKLDNWSTTRTVNRGLEEE